MSSSHDGIHERNDALVCDMICMVGMPLTISSVEGSLSSQPNICHELALLAHSQENSKLREKRT